jgi:metal-responsive CopG/Arc/MetJ family transcriptional regulator
MTARQKFATQIRAELLDEIRGIAQAEGRQLQGVVEDALRVYLAERKRAHPRRHVMALYEFSHEKFAPLYERLAK